MSRQNSNNDPLSRENLSLTQDQNLQFLDVLSESVLKVCNVNVVKSLEYEFIQILNNMHLRSVLKEVESDST